MNHDHLSEREISSLLIEHEQADEMIRRHLKDCRKCRKRLRALQEFTEAFYQQIAASQINSNAVKPKILSSRSERRLPILGVRWATAVVSAFAVIACVILLTQIDVIPVKTTKIAEVGFLEGIHGFSEDMVESELPEGLQALSGWDRQDFRRFLDFFTPLEEEHYEKDDFSNRNRSTSGIMPFLAA